MAKKRFKKMALGGTFDIIHKGHEELILKAFESSRRVVIGLTSDEFAKKLHKEHSVGEYEKRRDSLMDFLRERKLEKRSEIVTLEDPYGPAASDKTFDAIIVSKESVKNAKIINEIRNENQIPPLQIISINLVLADNDIPISTTRIKEAMIDRDGNIIENESC